MKLFNFFFIVLLVLFLQLKVGSTLIIKDTVPDLFIVAVVYFALFGKPRESFIASLSLGITKDVFSAGRFGIYSVSFILIGSIINHYRGMFFGKNPSCQISLSFVASFAGCLFQSCVLKLSYPHLDFASLAKISIFVAIYTALIAPFLFAILVSLREWLGLRGKGRFDMI